MQRDINNYYFIIRGDKISEISNSAFKGCSNLNSVSIGDNIVSIGESAFSDCVELKTISIPSKVDKIQPYAFSNCKTLNNVTVSGNLSYVGDAAFSGCIKLNKFTYKGTVPPKYDDKGIGVFSNCPELDNVSVPKDYKGDNFCGYKIDLKKKSGISIEDIKTIASIGASLVTIVTGAFALRFCCPKGWNKLMGWICCGRFTVPIDEQPTNVQEHSSSVNDESLLNNDETYN